MIFIKVVTNYDLRDIILLNKKGVVRGNYFDALTQTTLSVQGAVDKESKRVAWTVGENKEVAYETGLVNLSREESQMLVHYGKDKTQQWTIVRLEAPEEAPRFESYP